MIQHLALFIYRKAAGSHMFGKKPEKLEFHFIFSNKKYNYSIRDIVSTTSMLAVSTSTFVHLFLEPRMHSMALRRSANDSFVRIQLVTSQIDKSRFSEIFIDKTDINVSVSLLEPPL